MNGSTRKHSTDTRNIPVHDRKSFTMRSYEIRARNFLRMCSCKLLDLKSFGFCTYEKIGGGGASLDQSAKEFDSRGPLRKNRHSVGQALLPVLTTTTSGAHKR